MLAIIPARAGSKGIPNKAMQVVDGKPLILRTLETVKASGVARQIVVSTDSLEILGYCRLRGYEAIERPLKLAGDKIPLLQVAQQASYAAHHTGAVGIFQPTCPLITPETIRRMVRTWREANSDWVIGVTDDSHIFWRDGEVIGRRFNRQYRKPLKRESGAIQIMTQHHLKTGGGGRKAIVNIPADEALDIDTMDELHTAEARLRHGHVHFTVLVGERFGSGHYHRSLALAKALRGHSITWQWLGEPDIEQEDAVRRVTTRGLVTPTNRAVTVFDCLRPPRQHVEMAQQAGRKIVVLEDETRDSKQDADLIVNELLDDSDRKYAVLRDEFHHLPPREHRENADRVLITFGGTDPARRTKPTTELLDAIPSLTVKAIEPGSVTEMAKLMRWADVMVTSRGRTVLEAAATETPCISVAVNERERRHKPIDGVSYCAKVDGSLASEVTRILGSRSTREQMARRAKSKIDFGGTARLVHAIEGLMLHA